MTNLRWAIVAAAFALLLSASLLPGRPTSTARPVTVHFDGLPAAVLGALQR